MIARCVSVALYAALVAYGVCVFAFCACVAAVAL